MTNARDDMKLRWEKLHRQARFRPRYPHEQVVTWVFRNFDRDATPPSRILDLGCGGGRHSIFLASEGFDTWSCDLSSVGLQESQAAAQALLGAAEDLMALSGSGDDENAQRRDHSSGNGSGRAGGPTAQRTRRAA